MSCPRCQDLELALEVRRSEYDEALASAYFRVNRKIAAYLSVELERARNELEEHRLVCVSEVKRPDAFSSVSPHRFTHEEIQNLPDRDRRLTAHCEGRKKLVLVSDMHASAKSTSLQ